MENMYIRPVRNDWTKDGSIIGNVIALYKGRSVNLGYPGVAPYQPALGNMWGFNEAEEKGYFEVLTERDALTTLTLPVYVIGVDESSRVMQFIQPINELAKMNPIFGSDLNNVTSKDEVKKLKRVL